MANSLVFLLTISLFPLLLHSQQPYGGSSGLDCNSQSPSVLGYSCNGQSTTCQTFLTFHALPPYQSVPAISSLFGSDPSQLTQANLVSDEHATFLNNTKVLVPVNCSCSGSLYQYNTSYIVQARDTVFTIADTVFQGLTTCSAIQTLDNINPNNLKVGSSINVPLRCACPTRNQAANGVKFLLTFLIDQGDTIYMISQNFKLTQKSILDSNEMSETNPTIYYPTTLLIPLEKQPIPSQLATPSPPPQSPSPPAPPPSGKSSNSTGVYVGVGVGAAVLVSVLSLIAFYLIKAKKKQDMEIDSVTYIKQHEKSSKMSKTSEDVLFGIHEMGQAVKVYQYEELQLATKNFSEESRIEASVYLGLLNGDFAAIKIMSGVISQEIQILKKINHFNLVKLTGICFNEGRWYLVYEYAENGSLKSWIFDKSGSKVLSWIQRVQIALDVATGLNYLHRFAVPSRLNKLTWQGSFNFSWIEYK